MAKRRTIYSGFRDFKKTYQRYVRDYYRKARSLYRRKHHLKTARGISKAEIKTAMYDEDLLPRKELATQYKEYKRILKEQGSTSDPIQYIISKQAYQFSEKQYRGFREAVEEAVYYDPDFASFRNITQEEFRTGEFRTDEFFDMVKDYYHQKLLEGEAEGKTGKDLWLFAQEETARLYFGSK